MWRFPAIGVVCGLAATFLTRWTGSVRVLEPLVVLMLAYASYLLAELFHFSGILAISFCGLTMKWYLQSNISHKSRTTVKYSLKMLCRCCECIMFLFLGVSVVSDDHFWSTGFVLFTLIFCLLYRFIGVIIQTAFLNKLRIRKLKSLDQFIMGFSGLRGAIAYWLVKAIDEDVVGVDVKRAFVTATVSVIIFTVFVQGTTIKPLVKLLDVELNELNLKSLHHHVFADSIDHIMGGIEIISKIRGDNWLRAKFNLFNEKFLHPAVMNMPRAASKSNILEVYKKISYSDALAAAREHTSASMPSQLDLRGLSGGLSRAPTMRRLDSGLSPLSRSLAHFSDAEPSPHMQRHVSFVGLSAAAGDSDEEAQSRI